jgi:hypothetical protein
VPEPELLLISGLTWLLILRTRRRRARLVVRRAA